MQINKQTQLSYFTDWKNHYTELSSAHAKAVFSQTISATKMHIETNLKQPSLTIQAFLLADFIINMLLVLDSQAKTFTFNLELITVPFQVVELGAEGSLSPPTSNVQSGLS